jgi:hypothetical protein
MKKLLIGLVTVLHMIPHPFGVSPVGAAALYAGAYGSDKSSWAIPLLPLFVAALVFGFYEPVVMVFVFAGFSLSTLAGRCLLRSDRNLSRFGGAVVAGATIFFLVSNLGNWFAFMQPLTLEGLILCYVNGLPFFGQAILADAAYCFVIFGLHNVIERHEPAAALA